MGRQEPFAERVHIEKYRLEGESFEEAVTRVANALADNPQHFRTLREILLEQRFLPGGRIQAGAGAPRKVTLYNCFVSGTISDSFVDGGGSIMQRATQAAQTMRMGGGIGYDFSTLRPRGELIKSLGAAASGPLSFMEIYNSVCHTVQSAGHRRGAQMAVMRVDHPDIINFIHAKQNTDKLTQFNTSVAVTDEFMEALALGRPFELKWGGRVYATVEPEMLWEMLMRSTWDWAEPGVLFIDTINRMNNLRYAEEIAATNPCVAEGTLVSTPAGYVPVEHIKSGDLIMTVRGARPVTSVEKHENVPVFEVEFTDGTRIKATAAHIFHTRNRSTKLWNSDTRLDALGIGSKVRTSYIPFKPTSNGDSYNAGLLNGALLGDGCLVKHTNGAALSFGKHEYDWLDAFRSLCGEWCSGVYEDKTANVLNILKSAPIIVPRRKSADKYLPLELINGDDSWCKGVVDGYFSTDGNVHTAIANPMVRASSRSFELLRSIKLILARYGVRTSIYTYAKKDTMIAGRAIHFNGPVHTLVILGENVVRFYENFHLSHPARQKKLHDLVLNYCLSGDTHTTTIKKITPAGCATVYDVYEQETDTWITEGIVNRGCGEQPLPPNGACLLGSFNLTKYATPTNFDWQQFTADIDPVARAMDNVVDISLYPLTEQAQEAKMKRRMGLGITGLANAAELQGFAYGSSEFLEFEGRVLRTLANVAYVSSVEMAQDKGAFPMFDAEQYCASPFVKQLEPDVQSYIKKFGIRNSHLTSIAPTGTISMSAGNVSSGVEPVFDYEINRTIQAFDGARTEKITDYAYREHGVRGKRAGDCTAGEHLAVLAAAQRWCDSAVSKTCNVNPTMAWDDFGKLYSRAWSLGCKGITTFNSGGKRFGILESSVPGDDTGAACYVDASTGSRTCDV